MVYYFCSYCLWFPTVKCGMRYFYVGSVGSETGGNFKLLIVLAWVNSQLKCQSMLLVLLPDIHRHKDWRAHKFPTYLFQWTIWVSILILSISVVYIMQSNRLFGGNNQSRLSEIWFSHATLTTVGSVADLNLSLKTAKWN